MDNWSDQMSEIVESAIFFKTADVLDVTFTSGESLETATFMSQDKRQVAQNHLTDLPVDAILCFYDGGVYTPLSLDVDAAIYTKTGKLLDKQKKENNKKMYTSQAYWYSIQGEYIPEGDLQLQ